MMNTTELLAVGTWNFRPEKRGLHLLAYNPRTAEMEELSWIDRDINAGQQVFDRNRGILYITDEVAGPDGADAGGGSVRAYRADKEKNTLTFIGEQSVLLSKPAYLSLDETGNYLLAACHAGRAGITRIVRGADGSFHSSIQHDDAGIVLLDLHEDGTPGTVRDVMTFEGLSDAPGQVISHPHSVKKAPGQNLFYSCDKGLDVIHCFRLDAEKGKLLRLADCPAEHASAPRYLAFHPILPVLYENNETGRWVYAFRYDTESGALQQISKVPAADQEHERSMASDLLLTRDGRILYCGVRSTGTIAVFRTDPESGALSLLQNFTSADPVRGMTLSPDERFLIAASDSGGTVTAYSTDKDGTLKEPVHSISIPNAADPGFL